MRVASLTISAATAAKEWTVVILVAVVAAVTEPLVVKASAYLSPSSRVLPLARTLVASPLRRSAKRVGIESCIDWCRRGIPRQSVPTLYLSD